MNQHREKCDKLKRIRKGLADRLGIDLHQRECTFEGECRGTCPKCRQEEERLNKALLGKTAAVAISAGMLLTGCQGEEGGVMPLEAENAQTEFDRGETAGGRMPVEPGEQETQEQIAGMLSDIPEASFENEELLGETIEGEIAVSELEGDVAFVVPEEDAGE